MKVLLRQLETWKRRLAALCGMVIYAGYVFRWRKMRIFLVLVASVFPFEQFIFDAWLRRQADAFGNS